MLSCLFIFIWNNENDLGWGWIVAPLWTLNWEELDHLCQFGARTVDDKVICIPGLEHLGELFGHLLCKGQKTNSIYEHG